VVLGWLWVSVATAVPASAEVSFATEGQLVDEVAGTIAVPVQLSAVSGTDTVVDFAVSGSATEPDDFTLAASPLIVPAGASSADLLIHVVADALPDTPETIVIDLLDAPTWWDEQWRFRVPIEFAVGSHARENHVTETAIDFTTLLSALGESAAIELDSLRVIEVDADGMVVDPAVPFQFDADPGFDPLSNASGTLMIQLTGTTAAGVSRFYQVYFDLGAGFVAASVPALVSFDEGAYDEGQDSYQVTTAGATYFYHKLGAGFSSLVDADGNDWIDYHPTGGALGNFRGIPNLTYTEGYFHPGITTAVSNVIAHGPLRAAFESVSPDGLWRIRWDIFPDFARMTVLDADAAFWFMYEGAPGGSLDLVTDLLVRADGTTTQATQKWDTDLAGEEWLYVADTVIGRSLFLAHHEDDAALDSYWPFGSKMTVLGFGRTAEGEPLAPLMTGAPQTFSFGLMDETSHPAAATIIRGATVAVAATVGAAADRDALPIARHVVTITRPFVELVGTASGGHVGVTIDGIDVLVTTTAGQTSAEVALALATAIANEPLLSGVQVSSSGSRVLTSGQVENLSITDSGFVDASGVAVPVLSAEGLVLLVISLLAPAARWIGTRGA